MLRVDATIASLAPGGDGVAHVEIDGERRAIFLSRTAPGDVVRAEIDPSHRPARGRVIALVAPGKERVDPPCESFALCGGCDWMHLSAGAQGEGHVEHLRAALPAPWRDLPIAFHPAPAALAYRTRVRLHVRCERGRVAVGMYRARSHEPVAVDACVVLDPALESARRGLAALFAGSRGRGEALLALGVDRVPVLDVRWTGEVERSCFGRLEQAVARGELAGARVTIGDASVPATIGDATPWMTGADGAPLRLAPGGFAQAGERGNALLAQHVARVVAERPVERGVELYAGSGNLTVLLAGAVREWVAVESDRGACDAARWNLAARKIEARVVEADAESYAFSPATKLVVLDPPRTGARAVAARLAGSRVRHVVYVSCDPATLGRDLQLLVGAYRPRSVAAFELFPQTSHVEAVVALERVAPSAA
ncbi:MAG TPA: class I SAM-dependent RNA methyltransferase [Polyangiaceae bacterium]|jgi:23S rRNA (uracil1939-C5)-methyltransferase